MYNFRISENLESILKKLSKKEPQLHNRVLDKIREIVNCIDVEHYKNLRYNMKDSKRVHIGHFVLIFQFIKENNEILFDDLDHHDTVYRR